MILYEAMGLKRFIKLTTKKFIEKKIESSHQIVHDVFTHEEMGEYRVKAYQFNRNRT